MTSEKNIKKLVCLQIIPTMGIGGVETGVRDISKFLKKSNIQNYILCEESNKNLKERDLDIVYLKNKKTFILALEDNEGFIGIISNFDNY